MNDKLIFIDTEFTDFVDSQLISLGAVTPTGEEFYVEITDYDEQAQSEFVTETVIPLLDRKQFGQSRITASRLLNQWIQLLCDNGKDYTVVIDYSTDFILFDELRRMTFVEGYDHSLHPTLINTKLLGAFLSINNKRKDSIECYQAMIIGFEEYYEKVDNRRHHALVDAKSNMYGYQTAIDYLQK